MINLKQSSSPVASPPATNRSSSLSSYKSKRATSKNKNIDIQKLQQSVHDIENNLKNLNKCNSHQNLSNSSENMSWAMNDSFFGNKHDISVHEYDQSNLYETANLTISRRIQEKYNVLHQNIEEVEDDCENIENIKLSYGTPKSKVNTLKQQESTGVRQKTDKQNNIVKKMAPSKLLSKKSLNTVSKKTSNEKNQIVSKMNSYQQEILKYIGLEKKKQQQKITHLFAQILHVINEN